MMRRFILYLTIITLTVVSCGKEYFSSESISLSAVEESQTRAMMGDAALKETGNKLKVYDLLTDFSGDVSWMNAGNPFYINDEIVYNGNPIWDYSSGRAYPWTADGTHKFFSWLSYDHALGMTESSFCGASFNTSSLVLSIPQKEMNTTTDQFDFMYSDVVTIDAASHPANSSVNLQLHHLFTALNLTIHNTSGNTIYLKSVILRGMRNVRSATIDYSSSAVEVSTANIDSTDIVLFSSSDENGDVYTNEDVVKPLTDFIMMWPQTFGELSGARLIVEYRVFDTNSVLSDPLTATVVLNRQRLFSQENVGMNAGVKYTFSLQFKKSTIDIYTRALPWEYETYDWDYSDHSISARSGMPKDGVLMFYRKNATTGLYTVEPTTDEWSAKTMRFNTRNEILVGRFYIEAPTSGRWQITAYPLAAEQYFLIEPTSGEIDAYTENGMVEFTVSVNPAHTPSSTQTLFFNVAIYFNGEWHDANSEFNRKNIRLVLDAN